MKEKQQGISCEEFRGIIMRGGSAASAEEVEQVFHHAEICKLPHSVIDGCQVDLNTKLSTLSDRRTGISLAKKEYQRFLVRYQQKQDG